MPPDNVAAGIDRLFEERPSRENLTAALRKATEELERLRRVQTAAIRLVEAHRGEPSGLMVDLAVALADAHRP